jgi:hypothetical protein
MGAPPIAFSHVRWNVVHQRPQHLMTHLSTHRRVFFYEELVTNVADDFLDITQINPRRSVCRPHTRSGIAARDEAASHERMRTLIDAPKAASTQLAETKVWKSDANVTALEQHATRPATHRSTVVLTGAN